MHREGAFRIKRDRARLPGRAVAWSTQPLGFFLDSGGAR